MEERWLHLIVRSQHRLCVAFVWEETTLSAPAGFHLWPSYLLHLVHHLYAHEDVISVELHADFAFPCGEGAVAGKRQRLREHGLWLMEEESYFTQGNFLHIVDVEKGYQHIVQKYAPTCESPA